MGLSGSCVSFCGNHGNLGDTLLTGFNIAFDALQKVVKPLGASVHHTAFSQLLQHFCGFFQSGKAVRQGVVRVLQQRDRLVLVALQRVDPLPGHRQNGSFHRIEHHTIQAFQRALKAVNQLLLCQGFLAFNLHIPAIDQLGKNESGIATGSSQSAVRGTGKHQVHILFQSQILHNRFHGRGQVGPGIPIWYREYINSVQLCLVLNHFVRPSHQSIIDMSSID